VHLLSTCHLFLRLSYLCRHKQRLEARERATLVQGLQLPQPSMTAPVSLPPALPLLPQPPVFAAAEHSYAVRVDTSGQAVGRRVRGRQRRVPAPPPAADPDAAPVEEAVDQEEQQPVPGPSSPRVPRTTAWRRRREEEEEAAGTSGPSSPKRPRKQYTCSRCGGTGHAQYYGQMYCPVSSGVSFEQWKADAVAAREAKRRAARAADEGRAD